MPSVDLSRAEAATALAVSAAVSVVMLLWLGFALSRLFPRWGRAAWKGWVPLVNAGEILSIAGFRAWHAALLVLPVLQLYVLVLLAVAVHRITVRTGHGAVMTLVGLVIPPVWATLLLRSDGDPRTPRPFIGAAPRLAAQAREARQTTAVPRGGATSGIVTPQPPAGPAAALAPARAERVHAPESTARVEPPTPLKPPTTVEPSAPVEPPTPVGQDSELPAFLRDGESPLSPTAPGPLETRRSVEPLRPAEDEHGDTVVVDRRPRVRWTLHVEGVGDLPLTATRVVLGRRPHTADARVQTLAIPDTTRTLSKNHARLDLDDGEWTITDLHSTNSVLLLEPHGRERLLPAGSSAKVTGRFVLGELAMSLSFEEGRA